MKKIMTLPSILLLLLSCDKDFDPVYRDMMRELVVSISDYAHLQDEGFLVIPQNGHSLVLYEEIPDSTPAYPYIEAIDGAGQEDLFFGYSSDDQPTSLEDTEEMMKYLDILEANGVEVLVTDYCSSPEYMNLSYLMNEQDGFISFAAPDRELNTIPGPPAPYHENTMQIRTLRSARNFLYLINPENYSTKEAFTDAVSGSNYDVLIIDLFFNGEALTANDIARLRLKSNGGSSLVIMYMSIGEAEDYRYYWKESWEKEKPGWLEKENPLWRGNYKVRYWSKEWQDIIFGTDSSYLDLILSTGADGVYLDIVDAFEYFE